jgi:hypothetical protein
MALVVLVGSAGLWVSARVRGEPWWWGGAGVLGVGQGEDGVEDAARALENGVFSQLHLRRDWTGGAGEAGGGGLRASAAWSVGLRAEQANAWLETRLPKWVAGQVRASREVGGESAEVPGGAVVLASSAGGAGAPMETPGPDGRAGLEELGESGRRARIVEDAAGEGGAVEGMRWPEEIRSVRVRFVAGEILIGARVERAGRSQVVGAALRPELRGDGSLWLVAQRVSVGGLTVPASWVLREGGGGAEELVPEALRDVPAAADFFRVFAGELPVVRDSSVRLSDGRRVRLMGIESVQTTEGERLVLTCRTERGG